MYGVDWSWLSAGVALSKLKMVIIGWRVGEVVEVGVSDSCWRRHWLRCGDDKGGIIEVEVAVDLRVSIGAEVG